MQVSRPAQEGALSKDPAWTCVSLRPMLQWGCSHPNLSIITASLWPPDTETDLFTFLKLNESTACGAGELRGCWLVSELGLGVQRIQSPSYTEWPDRSATW